jgi:cytochrome c peroxidase
LLPFSSIIPAVDATITGLIGLPSAAGSISNSGAVTQAGGGGQVQLDKLVSKGAKLFFEETFRGNGRTCGSCHPLSNNFTIDPPFIATLPANDPLFVAEFNPALANLEVPQLMRQFGLILENLDGLEDPINKRVMRSVPHTLGMQVSLNQDVTQVAPPFNTTPAEMTGWSGDGAPGAGSLRDFATGAVTQHFTKSLQRIPNQDFKLPTPKQLDAMEAFQLSLGRDKEFNLAKITFKDANVQTGMNLFNNGAMPANPNAGGRCAVCHNNGGANFSPLAPAPAPNPTFPNRNFNTNVEAVVNPARAVVNFPIDGGFGSLPANPDGSFGNRAFNTASGIEAADTPPFFHNNITNTLEGVVDFYNGPVFNGPLPPAARFAFSPTQVVQVAHFMRGINTLQNIEVAARELDEITNISGNPEKEMQTRLQTAFNDIRDGINVLNQGGLYPVAVNQLIAARNFVSQAQQPNTGNARRHFATQAIGQLNLARATIATIVP